MHLLVAANASKRLCDVASGANFIYALPSISGNVLHEARTATVGGVGDVLDGERASHAGNPLVCPASNGGIGLGGNFLQRIPENCIAGRSSEASSDTHLLGGNAVKFTKTNNRVR